MMRLTKTTLQHTTVLAAGTLALTAPSSAYAQDASADDEVGVADIVVTAEKRETTAQTTPIAMDVFDDEALQRNGVASLESLSSVSPTINFAQNQAAAVITIRGVSSRDESEVGDPAVAVSTDGFYMQRPVGLAATMFDLERIEVLRGPQGTLYGRNATGGAINIITKKPELGEVSGMGAVTFGNYDTFNAEGAINLPIGETLAVRASFTRRMHDGYTKLTLRDADDEDSKAGRIHLLWQPTSSFSALLTASFLRQRGVGPQGVGILAVLDDEGNPTHEKPEIPGYGYRFGVNTPTSTSTDINTYQWNLAYELDPFTVTYLGGYSEMKFDRVTDLEGLEDVSGGFTQHERPETINHELRLSSNGDGPLSWQLGGFYFREKNALYSTLQTYFDDGSYYDWGIFDFPKIEAESKAVFGQVNYGFANGLSLEGGLRYSKDDKLRQGYMEFYGYQIPEDSRAKSDALTWHAAADWQLAPANMIYAKADKGYKAGGFNNGSAYDPEYLQSYEVGTKNYMLGRKLLLNANAFYYDYKDMQVKQYVGSVEREIIRNAGKAELYGAELTAILQPTSTDKLEAGVAYLHARFKELEVSDGSGLNDDLSGNTLQQAPKWSLNGAYQHDFNMPNGDLSARLQTTLRSATYQTIYNYPTDRMGAYTKTDFTLTYSAFSGWQLMAFVRNIENTKVINTVNENFGDNSVYYQFGMPRTYGLRASVEF